MVLTPSLNPPHTASLRPLRLEACPHLLERRNGRPARVD
jgi:hypothetical protein